MQDGSIFYRAQTLQGVLVMAQFRNLNGQAVGRLQTPVRRGTMRLMTSWTIALPKDRGVLLHMRIVFYYSFARRPKRA